MATAYTNVECVNAKKITMEIFANVPTSFAEVILTAYAEVPDLKYAVVLYMVDMLLYTVHNV